MKTVVLTIGPRGAGKTTFCNELLALCPKIKLISRDQILARVYGSVSINPYIDDGSEGYRIMYKIVARYLKRQGTTIILDCWNGFDGERRNITENLRRIGAEIIVGWYFITPVETCVKWFLSKEPSQVMGLGADSCRRDYELYHSQPIELDQGFDSIHLINPLQLRLSV